VSGVEDLPRRRDGLRERRHDGRWRKGELAKKLGGCRIHTRSFRSLPPSRRKDAQLPRERAKYSSSAVSSLPKNGRVGAPTIY
jgi:hypothetical protein